MVQKRLLDVYVLSNESEEARSIDKGRPIDTYASMNARRYKHTLWLSAENIPISYFSCLKLLFNRVPTVREKSGGRRF